MRANLAAKQYAGSGVERGTGCNDGRHQRPFLGLVQPVFHFFPGNRGALTAHDFQSVKLNLRMHCKLRKLRHKAPTTLAASCRTQTKDFVIQRDEIVAGYF
jgi:hypothetical protein